MLSFGTFISLSDTVIVPHRSRQKSRKLACYVQSRVVVARRSTYFLQMRTRTLICERGSSHFGGDTLDMTHSEGPKKRTRSLLAVNDLIVLSTLMFWLTDLH
jgi:hypothetical protein